MLKVRTMFGDHKMQRGTDPGRHCHGSRRHLGGEKGQGGDSKRISVSAAVLAAGLAFACFGVPGRVATDEVSTSSEKRMM
jgi:hypothetical protein